MHCCIMLSCIMLFLNRERELKALDDTLSRQRRGFAVISGRRRVGKTRLLVEWVRGHGGVYFVADASTPALQRKYFAEAIARRLPGFEAVEYRDWRSLFARLAVDAARVRFRGPVVIDELPYLVASSPELPSVLQQWLDHEGANARMTLAVAGSSQRMMQGLVLDRSAPLFGRATAVLDVKPLAPQWLRRAFPRLHGFDQLLAWTAWGGVPRYWELASERPGSVESAIDSLVLDPQGPLHLEPDRLLLEESPPAVELRPLLDAIGAGAHRVSEIAARIGRPATALSRALERLQSLELVERETPFGMSARDTKRSLYRLADPFLRLWFRIVAPARGQLALATAAERRRMLEVHLPNLAGLALEELARRAVPRLGDWGPAQRWWQGSQPEWDVVARSPSNAVLLGEVRALQRPPTLKALRSEVDRLLLRSPPELDFQPTHLERALFVPSVPSGTPSRIREVSIVTLDTILEAD